MFLFVESAFLLVHYHQFMYLPVNDAMTTLDWLFNFIFVLFILKVIVFCIDLYC